MKTYILVEAFHLKNLWMYFKIQSMNLRWASAERQTARVRMARCSSIFTDNSGTNRETDFVRWMRVGRKPSLWIQFRFQTLTLHSGFGPRCDTAVSRNKLFQLSGYSHKTPILRFMLWCCQDHYHQQWLAVSIQFGLWFCSGQNLPMYGA